MFTNFWHTRWDISASHLFLQKTNCTFLWKGHESGYQLGRTTSKYEGHAGKLCKENTERDAKMKHQNQWIASLTKKLEKQPLEACDKGSQSKESDKESNYSEGSAMSCHPIVVYLIFTWYRYDSPENTCCYFRLIIFCFVLLHCLTFFACFCFCVAQPKKKATNCFATFPWIN